MGKNLIIYYSRNGENYVNGKVRSLVKGNTEICAEFIWKAMWQDSELFRIETVKEYPEDYTKCTEEAKEELRTGARPELKRYIDDISEYDNIFVCGPNWWGTFPCAVFSLLERLDLNGKKVMILITHEGSGLGRVEEDMKKVCAGAVFGESMEVRGSYVAEAQWKVSEWAAESVK